MRPITRQEQAPDAMATERARLFALLGRLLVAGPDAHLLSALAGLPGDASPLGKCYRALAEAAAATDAVTVEREFHDLFIGLGRGELLPFASYYITGFLHERPLAELRGDLARLGIARADGVAEPGKPGVADVNPTGEFVIRLGSGAAGIAKRARVQYVPPVLPPMSEEEARTAIPRYFGLVPAPATVAIQPGDGIRP